MTDAQWQDLVMRLEYEKGLFRSLALSEKKRADTLFSLLEPHLKMRNIMDDLRWSGYCDNCGMWIEGAMPLYVVTGNFFCNNCYATYKKGMLSLEKENQNVDKEIQSTRSEILLPRALSRS